ncbi:MAG: TetR/AcrR family transcriptional regulator [Desulfobacteraceae bacterium]
MAHMKETLISVATDLFYEKGYFATSISRIAQGCGIQKASIYHHFAGKEELLFGIMETTMAELLKELDKNLKAAVGVEQRMRAAVRSHVAFHLRRQKETFIASSELRGLSESNLARIVALRDQYEAVFQNLIAAGMEGGLFEPGDIKILSYAILTLCTAGATWYKPNGRLSIAAIVEIYENFILNGLRKGQLTGNRPAALACDPWPI